MTIDPSGITVRRTHTTLDALSTLFMVVVSIGMVLSWPLLWAAPGALFALFAISAGFVLLTTANMLRHLLAQPMLRLTTHEIVLTHRWFGWGRAIRFSLAEVTIGSVREEGPDAASWSVIVLRDGQQTARFPLRRAEGADADQAHSDLLWVTDTLEAARLKRIGVFEGSRNILEDALASVRRAATEERPASSRES